jgi:hypothetical protein
MLVSLPWSVRHPRGWSFDASNLVSVGTLLTDWGLGEGDRLMDPNFSLNFLPRSLRRCNIADVDADGRDDGRYR